MKPEPESIREQNRRSWNAATRAHNSHKADQAGFLREGGSTLFPEEVELLGDVRGKRLAHLQCNAGQDTLSLVRHGAVVTGVDFSDEAIRFASDLSRESGIPAEFHLADVHEWLEKAAARGERQDVVFCSYGAICWLSDLRRWASGIASVLEPGGFFACVDFHPTAMMFEEDLSRKYPYFQGGEPWYWKEGVSDYVAASAGSLSPSGHLEGARGFENPHGIYEYCWNLGEILTALLDAGLALEHFREYPYANGCRLFQGMVEGEGRRMCLPEGTPSMPLMYAIRARRRTVDDLRGSDPVRS